MLATDSKTIAAEIVALINSRPQSPTIDEIAAVLERFGIRRAPLAGVDPPMIVDPPVRGSGGGNDPGGLTAIDAEGY